jgi:predicted metal-dependent peptidase
MGKKITRFKTIPKVQNMEPKKERNDWKMLEKNFMEKLGKGRKLKLRREKKKRKKSSYINKSLDNYVIHVPISYL